VWFLVNCSGATSVGLDSPVDAMVVRVLYDTMIDIIYNIHILVTSSVRICVLSYEEIGGLTSRCFKSKEVAMLQV
jgi:hypothetical protein